MDEEIKKILEDHESRIKKIESLLEEGKEPKAKGLSMKEFLLSKKPKDDVQKTLAIAYFLENERGMESFTVKDLEDSFREAKETVPGNINYKVIRCIQQGFMQEAKQKKETLKAWTLTSSGEKLVEQNFKKG